MLSDRPLVSLPSVASERLTVLKDLHSALVLEGSSDKLRLLDAFRSAPAQCSESPGGPKSSSQNRAFASPLPISWSPQDSFPLQDRDEHPTSHLISMPLHLY